MTSPRFTILTCLLLGGLTACLSVQDYGGNEPPAPAPDENAPVDPGLETEGPKPSGPRVWDWLNPSPTGRTLHAIGGTSESDIWVAGEGGTIAHFNGTSWDIRRSGVSAEEANTRWFAIGTRAKGDVWLAGSLNEKVEVTHFDGKTWTKSYPFAGASFGGFSRGPGGRLFAFMSGLNDWSILELASDGTWKQTDAKANDVNGPVVDIWVTASGEAWAMTAAAKILRLAPGASKWELRPAIAGIPSGSLGLGLAGAGTRLCAFYTGVAAGTGYAYYDGSWHVGPSDPDPIALDGELHGSRVACLSDGSGVMAYKGDVVAASPSAAPIIRAPYDFPGERLFGAWSIDGKQAYAVGTLGAFMTRALGETGTEFTEKGPTVRKDLVAIDFGTDGSAIVAGMNQPDPKYGGEVLFSKGNGALVTSQGSGIFSGPRSPIAVSMLDASDAWVLSNDNAGIGVAHWTGKWGATRFLHGSGPIVSQPQTIWAAAKDDVWATAKDAMWHYDGTEWSEVKVDTTYRSIHGRAPNDVWFAGDKGVAHWDGKALTKVAALGEKFGGVWSSAPDRVWLWGGDGGKAVLFDGKDKVVPVAKALKASAEWDVRGIAESSSGDVFVLTQKSVGTQLLWFDPTHAKLVDIVSSDLDLVAIRGRGERIAAVGKGGAFLGFVAADAPR